MQLNRRDLGAGVLLTAFGFLYGGIAWTSLHIGRALNMGPGYFPFLLSAIVVGIGCLIIALSFFERDQGEFGKITWRGLLFISAAVLFFAVSLESVGMFVTVFGATILAMLSERGQALVSTLVCAAVLSILCSIIFSVLLGLPVQVFGPALSVFRL